VLKNSALLTKKTGVEITYILMKVFTIDNRIVFNLAQQKAQISNCTLTLGGAVA